jgi:hypothetical protein
MARKTQTMWWRTTLCLAGAVAAVTSTKVGSADIRALDFLVGQCWRGDIGAGRSDTHCFATQYDGQFVKDRHVVTGGAQPYEGETLYFRDSDQGPLRYLYWSSSGVVEQGQVLPEDGQLVFPSVAMTERGEMQIRTILRPREDGCYDNLTEQKQADDWVVWWQARYCRVDTEQ